MLLLLACAPDVEPGTTLVGLSYPSHAQKVLEIEADGALVWMYRLPEAWTTGGDLAAFEWTDRDTLLMSVEGAGLFEVDRDGELVWSHRDPGAGLDVDRLADGNTLYARSRAALGRRQWSEVDRAGHLVATWSGPQDSWRTLTRDDDGAWLRLTDVHRSGQETHVASRNQNGVAEVGADGQVLRSWHLDSPPGTRFAETDGPVVGERPHGVEWLGPDRMLLASRRPHQVLEVEDGQVAWTFSDPDVQRIRDADRLEGGHTLVVGDDRVVEVDADGAVLWQWIAPQVEGEPAYPLVGAIRLRPDGTTADRD